MFYKKLLGASRGDWAWHVTGTPIRGCMHVPCVAALLYQIRSERPAYFAWQRFTWSQKSMIKVELFGWSWIMIHDKIGHLRTKSELIGKLLYKIVKKIWSGGLYLSVGKLYISATPSHLIKNQSSDLTQKGKNQCYLKSILL